MPERVYKRLDNAEPPAKKVKIHQHDGTGSSRPKGVNEEQSATQLDTIQPTKQYQKSSRSSDKLRAEADRLRPGRHRLPIWKHRESLLELLRQRNILIVVGETGSGKSTQVPQFLLNESWCKEQSASVNGQAVKIGGRVVVTQPRRVAAINLAKRVAKEFGTPLGKASPASKVGYSVRFDNCVSPSTLIKYVTEGMLLQEMIGDPWLRQYSTIVIDEVHERGVNVDLLLGFMKRMIINDFDGRGGVPLKIVVMSATAEVDMLQDFFRMDKTTGAPGADNEAGSVVSLCSIEGRQFPVQTIYTPKPVNDVLEGCLKTVLDINKKEPLPGDILVFLYGQEAIEAVENMVNDEAIHLDRSVPKLLVLPLFAALPQDAQQRVFQPTPPGTRKVILSTNIAETSVTVAGVRFVVDSGKFKMKQFRMSVGLESLLVKPISKSSAIQRKGRAGRETAGKCWRLYTEKDYHKLLPENTPPEILRCDLAHAILNMKARGVNDVMNFPFLDRPHREAFEEAFVQLMFVGALTKTGEMTAVGHRIAKLPLSVPLARVLVSAIEDESDVLPEVVDIVSGLSEGNIFLNLTTEENREEAEEARRSLYRREGDHLTILKTVQAYSAENTDRKAWSHKHFVNHRKMRAVMVSWVGQCFQNTVLTNLQDIRKQLRSQIANLSQYTFTDEIQSLSSDRAAAILKCFLKGFGRSVAKLCTDGSYKTLEQDQTVAIHPSSVLRGRKVVAIMYTEYVFTTNSYARGVSVVQNDWVGEVLQDWLKRSTE